MWTKIVPLLGNWLSDGQLVPLAAIVVAVFLLMSSLRRRQQQQMQRSGPASAPRPPDPPSTAVLRRDLDEVLVELQDLSRRVSAEIDTRFAKLEAAMRDADRRIAALSRLSRDLAEKAAGGGSTDRPDPRHTVIYELADAGFSPVEIARDLGKTPGEVELILNLRRQAK